MNTLLKYKPMLKESKFFRYFAYILSLVGIVPLLMPVTVAFMSKFSRITSAPDILYIILRGAFGVALIVGMTVYAVNKKILGITVPAVFATVTVALPLYDSIDTYISAKRIAESFSMTVDYSPYLLTIGEYLLFFLLCLFTVLFSLGLFRYSVIIMVVSVVSSLAALFTAINNYVTYGIEVYEIICFAYSIAVALIPAFVVLSTKPAPKKAKNNKEKPHKYQPKRMRE
ncbi:MAG: hypothetical protein ACI4GZ_05600 [Ruminococcus sp.]